MLVIYRKGIKDEPKCRGEKGAPQAEPEILELLELDR